MEKQTEPDFSPANHIVQLCLQSMVSEEKGNSDEAAELALKAWNEAGNNFEKFLAAHFMARYQTDINKKLEWFEKAFAFATGSTNIAAKSALSTIYSNIAQCYRQLGDPEHAKKYEMLATASKDKIIDGGPFYHGTKASLKVGDSLIAGFNSNYDSGITMNHVYFTALVNGAGLAASLAKGDGPGHVYVVEPTGAFENDPNVTDKKFPGNLTRSYRTEAPLKIVGEIQDWERLTPEELKKWGEKLASTKGKIIN
jgi:rifampin ADP-ribosylating transferase